MCTDTQQGQREVQEDSADPCRAPVQAAFAPPLHTTSALKGEHFRKPCALARGMCALVCVGDGQVCVSVHTCVQMQCGRGTRQSLGIRVGQGAE